VKVANVRMVRRKVMMMRKKMTRSLLCVASDVDEVYIDESEIDTTSEFHYQTGEKCPMELQRMEDEYVRQMIKDENNELSNTSSMFASIHLI
jgi:hypothetical protein